MLMVIPLYSGMELVEEWKKNGEVWCESPPTPISSSSSSSNRETERNETRTSKLICFPYHQVNISYRASQGVYLNTVRI